LTVQGRKQRFSPLPWLRRTSETEEAERELLRELILSSPWGIAHETLIHYYISAKSWPVTLLVGAQAVDCRRCFDFLARAIAGCCEGQVCVLSARPSGDGRIRSLPPDGIRERYYRMGLLDLWAEANTPGNEGRAYLVCLDDVTTPELLAYLHAWGLLRTEDYGPPWPPNLLLSAIVPSVELPQDIAPGLLARLGVVEIPVSPGPAEDTRSPRCPPVGWQRAMLRTMVREPAAAAQRLDSLRLLPALRRLLSSTRPLYSLAEGDILEAGIVVYAANSFAVDGQGLLDLSPEGNLREAIDLQLAQRVLPYLKMRCPGALDWAEWAERLAGLFPRARTRAYRFHLEALRAERSEAYGPPSAHT